MQRKHYLLPAVNQDYINNKDYFLLFETSLFDKNNFFSYIFFNPIKIIKIYRFKDIREAFEKIDRYSKEYYIAGYYSYELGYFFENLKYQDLYPHPLIHLGVFDKIIYFNHSTGETNTNIPRLFVRKEKNANFFVRDLKLNFSKNKYVNKINRIKKYIKKGDTYQVNFTGKYCFSFSGSSFSFYQDLKNRQKVPFSAFCKLKKEYVISLSPELFFKRQGLKFSSKPMKGTIARGRDINEDRIMSLRLKNNIKNRAENLMIADLIRNDIGRISEFGSVRVTDLFSIEKYNNLFQMTSTVKGILKKGTSYYDIFKNIFPGGSVTGAPKIRTMQIIKELENAPRGLYCGALGIIFPKNKAIFNLPIRTISLVHNRGEMGIGSGIVYDSDSLQEFDECLLKAKFLSDRYREFQILETILWDGQYAFLNEHLKRMEDSALYFDFPFSRLKISAELKIAACKFKSGYPYKTRLLLDKEGRVRIGYSKIKLYNKPKPEYIAISKYKVDPQNIFYYHKTTNRDLYDSEFKYYSSLGYFDVIFVNTRNEVCEGAISNIIIRKENQYYTPTASSGLLPGIFRKFLIKKRKLKEKIVSLEELLKADSIFLCSSVRGLTAVKIKNHHWGR